jgi:polysaccharide biosynthesis protein PslH
MKAKKILILTNRVPYPMNDGGNLAMRAMIDGYSEAGCEVFLLSMNTTRHWIEDGVLKTIYKNISGFETVTVDNEVKPIPTLLNYFFSHQPSHAVRFTHTGFTQKLKDVIHSFEPDVVQVESIYLTGYVNLINTLSKAIVVLRMHNIEYQVWERLAGETRPFFKKMYLSNLAGRIKKYELEAWAKYDLLLPITRYDAEVVRSFGIKKRMHTVPFGVNLSEVNSVSRSNIMVGYHIGAMDWLPNQEAMRWFLLEVWPEVKKANPNFRFEFAGRNMPTWFRDLQIDGVTCRGEVADAGAFAADKDILIVPLRSGGGIRVKILEAMQLGKVIISTSIGVQGIEVVDGVSFINADDNHLFVEKISWLLKNPNEAREIGKNAAQLVKTEYDNRKIIKELIGQLDAMITNRG